MKKKFTKQEDQVQNPCIESDGYTLTLKYSNAKDKTLRISLTRLTK